MFIDCALIDADSIYFKVCMKTQKKHEIRVGIDRKMRDISKYVGTDNIFVAVKGEGNFRKDLSSDYKKNRKPHEEHIRKALTYGHSYMIEKHKAIMANAMEADDLVSIWAKECRDLEKDYVVVGIDKDLLQIPGWHMNFDRMDDQYIDEDMGNYKLMLQCLTGDNSDNIKGIKGVGPKKAEKILAGVPMERRWNRVKAAWRKHNAGNPMDAWRLLKMIETWGEHEEILQQISKSQ